MFSIYDSLGHVFHLLMQFESSNYEFIKIKNFCYFRYFKFIQIAECGNK